VLFHAGVPAVTGGFVGVDVFFVLSGFLITNVLLHDIDMFGRIRFGEFYARRVRRLLPAAITVIAAASAAYLLVAGVVERLPFVRDGQSALLYVANWRFLAENNDYFAAGVAKSPFLHFWSLAVEEQFYVVFPLLLLLLLQLGRRRRWLVPAGFAVVFAASLAAQMYFAAADPNHAYYGTDARAYQLLAGVLLALLLRRKRQLTKAAGSAAALSGFAGLLVVSTAVVPVAPPPRGIAAVGFATLLIGGLVVSDRGPVSRWLSAPVPAYLGRISYGTYLWHWPLILILQHVGVTATLPVAAVTLVGSTALAALTYHLLELPIRRIPLTGYARWPVVAGGVAVCGVMAVVAVPPVLGSDQRPAVATAAARTPALPSPLRAIAAARAAAAGRHRQRVPHLNWPALAADYGPERSCQPANPAQCIAVHGHGLHILLVGDSHGRMLAPTLIALARERGFTLSLNVIPSCPWQANLVNLSQPPALQTRCSAARDQWYRQVLPLLHPDVVVLATYARDDEGVYGHTLKREGGSNETLHELIRNTSNETISRIRATGARVLIMRSIITASFDPLNCLSSAKYVDQCRVPVPRPPISDRYYLAAAKRGSGVFTFAVNNIVCPAAPLCDPVVDGISVWRNPNHYSTRILVHFRTAIWAAMVRTGVFTGLPSS
jgi:peptidoglycan/LPS O-acetylase OafA/YrhL